MFKLLLRLSSDPTSVESYQKPEMARSTTWDMKSRFERNRRHRSPHPRYVISYHLGLDFGQGYGDFLSRNQRLLS